MRFIHNKPGPVRTEIVELEGQNSIAKFLKRSFMVKTFQSSFPPFPNLDKIKVHFDVVKAQIKRRFL